MNKYKLEYTLNVTPAYTNFRSFVWDDQLFIYSRYDDTIDHFKFELVTESN